MLIDGYKFDMRIYVCITSFNPLEAFLYNEGFARLTTEKYSLSPEMIDNTFIHLTNYAVQKKNLNEQNENYLGGSKISLKMLFEKL